jgi:hypothetical protein
MPNFIHSKDAQLLINQFDLSAYINAYNAQAQLATHDVTCLTNQSPNYFPGLKSGNIVADGFFSPDTNVGSDVALPPLLGTNCVITLLPRGGAVGNRAYTLQELLKSYDIGVKVADMVRNHFAADSTDGYDYGVSLHPVQAETATGNGSSVDNSAATQNGGVAQIHATALTSNPSVVVKVQHSPDNSTWADLATFTALTAAGYQRLIVAAGTTVNRYLRAVWTFTGGTSPSLTFQCSFSRR